MTRKYAALRCTACFVLFLSSVVNAGVFKTARTFASGGYSSTAVAVGDVNGDGKPDLVVANATGAPHGSAGGSVTVLLGDGVGGFALAQTYDVVGASSVVLGDFNKDGRLDIAAGSSSSVGVVAVMLGNGDGSFGSPQQYATGGYYTVSLGVADLNHDGNLDLVATNLCQLSGCEGDHVIGVLLGKGDGTFKPAVEYDSGGGGEASFTIWARPFQWPT